MTTRDEIELLPGPDDEGDYDIGPGGHLPMRWPLVHHRACGTVFCGEAMEAIGTERGYDDAAYLGVGGCPTCTVVDLGGPHTQSKFDVLYPIVEVA